MRVFLSYSRVDGEEAFKKVASAFSKLNYRVFSDQEIGGGTAFTDAIKTFISHSHIFVALLTKSAGERPWIHQETGFAMARDIPIYLIKVAGANYPTEMASQIQVVEVDEDLSNLEDQLKNNPLEALLKSKKNQVPEVIKIAEWPEHRAEWLADYAEKVQLMGRPGKVRQIGGVSSFSIPNAHINADIWNKRDQENTRSELGRHMLRRERQALEWHAKRAGCRLMIGPRILQDQDAERVRTRLEILKEFVTDFEDIEKLEIAVAPHGVDNWNVTMVGDWFVAESMAPRSTGYRHTVFNWHAPSAKAWVKRFDDEFSELTNGIDPHSDGHRDHLVRIIDEQIAAFAGK
ncbi:MAG: toll/interleukin-1 receptor domain-containing protein [Verrucomicrobiales bacterium]|nr:toll/interleukin-1 receptor domain-containing protein [Verrucomicrobiales bacterium]